ncbi:hypothetical protein SAMN05421595_3107 [Austwickia chelonae]|nr:hypothetical protein [Austwickia chelonae]SEW43986.1 hypothetical protein SAMN05421595_3107 [Austwickia chelonae]
MGVTTITQDTQTTPVARRQLRHVELQGIDASRIISSLSGRNGRSWPTASQGNDSENVSNTQ